MQNDIHKLLKLACKQFGQLTDADRKLFQAVAEGQPADFSESEWNGDRRTLFADRIDWLCTDRKAQARLSHKGIVVKGAKIEGKLDLNFVTVEFPLSFEKCIFAEPLFLQEAKICSLNLEGSSVVSIDASRVQVENDVLLCNGFVAEGEARLYGASIGGNLNCEGGKFSDEKGCDTAEAADKKRYALNATGAKITGAVLLRKGFVAKGEVRFDGTSTDGDFVAKGEVRLYGASIDGDLDCDGGHFFNEEEYALNAEGATITGAVLLRSDFVAVTGKGLPRTRFVAIGEVRFYGASIGGNLNCDGGKFSNKKRYALNATGATITGSVLLSTRFVAIGEVRFYGASIGRILACDGGHFFNDGGKLSDDKGCDAEEATAEERYALYAVGATITGSVLLRKGFVAIGRVRFYRATIGGYFDCEGGHFSNKDKDYALDAQGAKIAGSVFLHKGFLAIGGVQLLEASIGGSLDCSEGQLSDEGKCALNAEEGKCALNAEGATVEGDVKLIDFKAVGKVDLSSTKIDDTLSIKDTKDKDTKDGQQMILDLRFARIGLLADDNKTWPSKGSKGKLYLNGLTYIAISESSPLNGKQRLDWLRYQNQEIFFSLQPYEQLASVLRTSGHETDAIEVLIGKQNDLRQYGKLGSLGKFWNWFLGVTIAHGYRPRRALWWSMGLISLGSVLFYCGNHHKLISPYNNVEVFVSPKEQEVSTKYPKFHAFFYSLDVFLPIVDLHQESHWLPNANAESDVTLLCFKIHLSGELFLWYLWVQIILGWVLTSLWVAGFSGLVRR